MIKLTFLLILLMVNGYTSYSTNFIDSLTVLAKTLDKEKKVDVLTQISDYYSATDSTLFFNIQEQALKISLKEKYLLGEAEVYRIYAKYYFFKEDIDFDHINLKSKEYIEKCLDISSKINYYKGLTYCYFYKAAIAYRKNDFIQTTENYIIAADYGILDKDFSFVSSIYNNLADIYFANKQYNLAIEYYKKGIGYIENSHIKSGVLNLGLGVTYLKIKDYTEAHLKLKSALLFLKKVEDKSNYQNVFIVYTYHAIAELFIDTDKLDSALMVLQIADTFDVHFASTETKYWFAKYYIETKDIDSALLYANIFLQKSLNDFKDWTVNIEKVIRAYKLLSDIYFLNNQFSNAYNCLLNYQIYTDSSYNIETTEKILEITKKYEAEIKIKEIENLAIDNKNKGLKINALILISVLLFTVMALMFFLWNSRKKIHEKDKELFNDKIEIQKKELEKKEIEKQNEIDKGKSAKEISELKFKNTQILLESKENELIANATYILLINQKFEKILTEAAKIQPYLNKEGKKMLIELNNNYKIENQNETWNEFNNKFDNIHSTFYINISKQFPVLTSYEKKICALLSIDISTSEITTILDKSYNSVNVAISRLRMKTGVENTEELKKLLKSIENTTTNLHH